MTKNNCLVKYCRDVNELFIVQCVCENPDNRYNVFLQFVSFILDIQLEIFTINMFESIFDINEIFSQIIQDSSAYDLINLYLSNSEVREVFNRQIIIKSIFTRHNMANKPDFPYFAKTYCGVFGIEPFSSLDNKYLKKSMKTAIRIGDIFTLLEIRNVLIGRSHSISYRGIVNMAVKYDRLDIIKYIDNIIQIRGYLSLTKAVYANALDVAIWIHQNNIDIELPYLRYIG